mgnify:CR=1 FL=1
MKLQTPAYLTRLLEIRTPPCVSIYLSTQRAFPPAAENPRRLRNLIDRAREQLATRYPRREWEPILNLIAGITDDAKIWRHPPDGLALFASPDNFEVVKLFRSVAESVTVADNFHLKPLIRRIQFAGRYQVLCLTHGLVALYEGSEDRLEPLELKGVPENIVAALGRRSQHPIQGQIQAPPAGGEPRTDSISGGEDPVRYFRVIDEAVWEFHSRPTGLPLILCSPSHHQRAFRDNSRNTHLLPEGININPENLELTRIAAEAWKIIQSHYQQQTSFLIDQYGLAKSRQQGSEDLQQVAEAATFSRVGVLMVDADKHIGGRLDPGTGKLELGDINRSDLDDVLDDIAERVIRTGGQVLVMPHDQMPTDTGLAAIYRY